MPRSHQWLAWAVPCLLTMRVSASRAGDWLVLTVVKIKRLVTLMVRTRAIRATTSLESRVTFTLSWRQSWTRLCSGAPMTAPRHKSVSINLRNIFKRRVRKLSSIVLLIAALTTMWVNLKSIIMLALMHQLHAIGATKSQCLDTRSSIIRTSPALHKLPVWNASVNMVAMIRTTSVTV